MILEGKPLRGKELESLKQFLQKTDVKDEKADVSPIVLLLFNALNWGLRLKAGTGNPDRGP